MSFQTELFERMQRTDELETQLARFKQGSVNQQQAPAPATSSGASNGVFCIDWY